MYGETSVKQVVNPTYGSCNWIISMSYKITEIHSTLILVLITGKTSLYHGSCFNDTQIRWIFVYLRNVVYSFIYYYIIIVNFTQDNCIHKYMWDYMQCIKTHSSVSAAKKTNIKVTFQVSISFKFGTLIMQIKAYIS